MCNNRKKLKVNFSTTVHECSVASIMSNSLRPYGLQATRLLCPWDSPGKSTGVGCHALLQGIFPTLALNLHLLCLLHCMRILYCLSHQGSTRILEWVAYPFSRGTSWPRNRTGVSCIAGRFFTIYQWRRQWHPTPVLLPGKSHGRRSLVGCSPWGR